MSRRPTKASSANTPCRPCLWQIITIWLVIAAVAVTTLWIHNRGIASLHSSFRSGHGEDHTFAVPGIVTRETQKTRRSMTPTSLVSSTVPTKTITTDRLANITLSKRTTKAESKSSKTSDQDMSLSSSVSTTIRERCFPHNTDRWLFGPKDSNHDVGVTPEHIQILMEGPRDFTKLPALFQMTICHPDSPLKQVLELHQSPNEFSPFYLQQRAEEWYQRFFYLAMHWKFHQFAYPEYQARKKCMDDSDISLQKDLQDFQTKHGIGNLDFECSDAKFVVSAIGHIGFGAFINTQVCMTILIALRSRRIPIFTVQSLYWWQKRGDTDPWLLAPTHCVRRDLQCYYMPITPCALLLDDIRNSTKYGSTKTEQRWLGKNMHIPEELQNQRVVSINSGLQNKGSETLKIRSIAANIVDELLKYWKEQSEHNDGLWSETDWQAMELARQWMVTKTEQDPTSLLRQIYVYFLRLNPHYMKVLQNRMSALIPKGMDPSHTVGMAIRGSDKCNKESTCLPFQRYMNLAEDVIYPKLKEISRTERPRLIMTTEDPSIFNESLSYQRNTSFPFQFLVNDEDNMQGSGFPKDFRNQGENTIVSSMTALQLHMSAGKVYLNCCSNFHAVIRNLIAAQCGAKRHGNAFAYSEVMTMNSTTTSSKLVLPIPTVAHCLNDAEVVPRRYQICCGWFDKKDTVCNQIWEEHFHNRPDLVKTKN